VELVPVVAVAVGVEVGAVVVVVVARRYHREGAWCRL
jgi:hypothetical protein